MRVFLLFISLFIAFAGCNKKAEVYHNDPIPEHDSHTLHSKILGEDRVISIWTPPAYDNSEKAFPVLYMPDGGTNEDFPHIANTLAKLIQEGKIPPHILVGIQNTERGRDLTGESIVEEHRKYKIPMSDGAKNFRSFIADELMSYINENYRTTEKKGIIGESLAGLFVVETFFLTPELFDFYIAMDPSLWWNNNYLVNHAEEYLKRLPLRQTKLWFAGSDAEDIYIHTNQLKETLERNQSENLIWHYSPEPNEQHSTIYRATKEKALIWSMNEQVKE